jgi:hypothetical protein
MTDLLDLIEEARLEAPAPCLFGSQARGLPARAAEYAAWKAVHGAFGSQPRSHAWAHAITHPKGQTGACRPSLMSADLRCGNWHHGSSHDGPCSCAGDLVYRGACTGCDWEGLVRLTENHATEDAHDHAWPGWRELPVIARAAPRGTSAEDKRDYDRWLEAAVPLHPAGWIESGGPVRTARQAGRGTRHVPGHGTPFGGYDMAAEAPR